MNKGTNVRISEYMEPNGAWIIYITNIGLRPENMRKCIDITKHFTKGDEFFFGHYRTDGFNITDEEFAQYSKEIPEYFQTNGRYEPLTVTYKRWGKVRECRRTLTTGCLPVSNGTYEMLPKIFHYYLETIYFCPKIDWKTFTESYRDYMKHATKDYVLNGYTDFLFAYVDSGDFSIEFDKNIYDKNKVYQDIQNILSK